MEKEEKVEKVEKVMEVSWRVESRCWCSLAGGHSKCPRLSKLRPDLQEERKPSFLSSRMDQKL